MSGGPSEPVDPQNRSGVAPRDPKEGRWDGLARALRVATVTIGVLAAAAAALPDSSGEGIAAAAIALVVVVPLVRIGWLAQRWLRRGDRRFGLTAVGLLCVAAAAVVLG